MRSSITNISSPQNSTKTYLSLLPRMHLLHPMIQHEPGKRRKEKAKM
uniref:Uncharacterized protein n=1 Tax=Manihot esculenta TaxID=3983 RepID=A0A2C9VQS1_MANES